MPIEKNVNSHYARAVAPLFSCDCSTSFRNHRGPGHRHTHECAHCQDTRIHAAKHTQKKDARQQSKPKKGNASMQSTYGLLQFAHTRIGKHKRRESFQQLRNSKRKNDKERKRQIARVAHTCTTAGPKRASMAAAKLSAPPPTAKTRRGRSTTLFTASSSPPLWPSASGGGCADFGGSARGGEGDTRCCATSRCKSWPCWSCHRGQPLTGRCSCHRGHPPSCCCSRFSRSRFRCAACCSACARARLRASCLAADGQLPGLLPALPFGPLLVLAPGLPHVLVVEHGEW